MSVDMTHLLSTTLHAMGLRWEPTPSPDDSAVRGNVAMLVPLRVPLALSGLELLQNAGAPQLMDLLGARIDAARKQLDAMAEALK